MQISKDNIENLTQLKKKKKKKSYSATQSDNVAIV